MLFLFQYGGYTYSDALDRVGLPGTAPARGGPAPADPSVERASGRDRERRPNRRPNSLSNLRHYGGGQSGHLGRGRGRTP
jgi:hypothetical protein